LCKAVQNEAFPALIPHQSSGCFAAWGLTESDMGKPGIFSFDHATGENVVAAQKRKLAVKRPEPNS